ncbi:hypothetical protein AGMMS50229_01480 [Campylobacterota bacterium]|nr:hypothetical protein AGMMS50229_01480 [Campylobacterota bacterium]
MNKAILMILAAALSACAETITIVDAPEATTEYTVVPSARSASGGASAKPMRFYRNGDKNDEVVATGKIIVSFTGKTDAAAFAKRWGLTNVQLLNEMFNTFVFDNPTADDDVTISAKIAKNESNIRYAKPDFEAKVTLH